MDPPITAATLVESCPQDFGASVFISAHPAKRAFVRSGTDVGWEGLACDRRSNTSQRSLMGMRSGPSPNAHD